MSANTLSLLHLFSLGQANLWLDGNVLELSLLRHVEERERDLPSL